MTVPRFEDIPATAIEPETRVPAFEDIPAQAAVPRADTWDYVLLQGGKISDLVPFTERQAYERIMADVKDREGFEDQLTSTLYMASLLEDMDTDVIWDGHLQYSRQIFGKELPPSQVVQMAVKNEQLIERWRNAWSGLVGAQERAGEMPDWFSDAIANPFVRGTSGILGAFAHGMEKTAEQGGPLPSLFGRPPWVKGFDEREKRFAQTMRANSQMFWEVAKNPELMTHRDDVITKLFAITSETLPYIGATTTGSVLGQYTMGGTVGAAGGGLVVGWAAGGNRAKRTAEDIFREKNGGKPLTPEQERLSDLIANGVGLVVGSIEAIGGRITDAAFRRITQKITNKAIQKGAAFGFGSLAEGMEEFSQEWTEIGGEEIIKGTKYSDIDWDESLRRSLVAAGGGLALGGSFHLMSTAIRGVTGESSYDEQMHALRVLASQEQLTEQMVKDLEESLNEQMEAAEAATKPPKEPEPTITPEEAKPPVAEEKAPAEAQKPKAEEHVPAKPVEGKQEKAPPMTQAGGISTEKVTPNLYIGNATPGMKKRIAKGMGVTPEDIEGFKEGGFPTKRTSIEMTRAAATNYMQWAIDAVDAIASQPSIDLTYNQLAMTQALIGDIKALQEAIGYEVKPAQITFRQAKKRKYAITGDPLISQERFNEISKKIKEEKELTEQDKADMAVALKEEIAATKAVKKLTAKQTIQAAVEPGKLEEVTMTSLQLFDKIMEGRSKEAKHAYVAAGRDMVKQHKNLAKVAKELLDKAEVTPGEQTRLMNAIAKARTETQQVHAMAAVQAVADKARKRKLAKRIKKSTPLSVDFFYREAIENIKAGIDPAFRKEKTIQARKRTQEYFKKHPEKDIPARVKKMLGKTSLDEMSIEELQEVIDAIEILEKRGKLKRKLSQAQKQRRFEEQEAAMLENLSKSQPIKIDEGPKVFATTKEGLVKTVVAKVRAWTLRPARIFDLLDGRENFEGPVHRFFIDKTNRLTDQKWRMADKRADAGKTKQKELDIGTQLLSSIRVVNGVRYTVDEMIDIYAKNKNSLARFAIIYGNNVTEADINAVIDNLSDNEKAWGDYIIEDYDANYGRLRNEVIEVENRDMGMEENYTPIRRTDIDYKTHTEEIVDAILQKENLRKAYAAKGFTLKRKEVPPEFQKPVRLGITRMWFEQVSKQEQYINLAQHIRDMHRIVDGVKWKNAVRSKFGKEYNKVIKDYVNRVANPNIYRSFNSLEELSRYLRRNTAVAYLAYNLVTMGKQIPSVTLYMQDAGITNLLASAVKFTANPLGTIQFVRDLDPQVKHKAIERELEELKSAHGNVVTQLINRFGKTGMHGIYMMDSVARTIGWHAVYNKALHDGKSEAEAVRLAQNSTLRTQPAAQAKDLPALYATNEFANWFVMFTNQLNQIYNIATYDIPSYIVNKKYGNAALASIGMGLTALTIWMLAHKDVPDEPKDLLEATGEQAINATPLVGKAIMVGKRGWGDNDIPAFKGAKAVGRSLAAIERGEYTDYDLKVAIEGICVIAGVPYIGPKRVIGAVKEGEASVLLGGKPKKKMTQLYEEREQ